MFFIVNHIKKNNVVKAYVFTGKEHDYKSIYKKNPHDEIFDGQLDIISLHNIPVEFVPIHIYLDDRIGIVKYKIASILQISMEEIYLFGTEHQMVHSIDVFKILTQNETVPLDKKTLDSFIYNLDKDIEIKSKQNYSYNDIYNLGLEGDQVMKMPIGQHITSSKRHFFTVNPFQWNSIIQEEVHDTNNNTLLLECLPLHNRIYLCTTEDVIEYALEKQLSVPNILKLYYPFLKEQSILSLDQYYSRREKLRESTYKFITGTSYIHSQESLELLYKLSKPNHEFISGITHLSILLEKQNDIPTELIFKLINTNDNVPLTIYNPGKNKENILRLYADKLTTNGQLIPYLPKSQIFSFIKTIATRPGVSVVVDDMICNFMEDGSIIIDIENITPTSIPDLTKKIKDKVNPVIMTIIEFIQQSGYTYPLFTSLYECKIINMNYDVKFDVVHNLSKHIRNYTGCISSVFNIDPNSTTTLRYKKVSNFNEVSSRVAHIINGFLQNLTNDEIIQGLQDNFNITQREASQELVKYANDFKIESLRNENKQPRVTVNPGFKTVISTERGTSHTTIQVQNINNIYYLEVIPLYIHAIYNLTQQRHGSHADTISNICNSSKKDEVLLTDVVHVESVQAITYEDEYEDLFGIEEEVIGGASSSPNIIGARLKSPNYFQERLMERDSKLFLKKKEGKYSAYSRVCPFSNRRQPVVVNKEELDYIDKTSPGSYDHVFSTGSTTEKAEQNHYICPRYWCMTKGISLTEEQVKEGKICGTKIIPHNAKSVPKDAFIYEFTDKSYHIKDGKYVTMHPSSLDAKKTHPDGLSVPCCFKGLHSKLQKERQEKTVKPAKVSEQYIMGPEKVPIPTQRWGDLPIQLQRFFHFNNATCYSGTHTRELNIEQQCVLRKGVEETATQSFLSCMADLYSKYQSDLIGKKIQLKLKEFKDVLIHALTLELFVSLQNGYLIEVFNLDNFPDHTPYIKSKIYKSLQKNPLYLNRTISAYENFKEYIVSDHEIDYAYMWDFMCLPNSQLFIEGINLILLDIPDDDITNNIEIICPSNSYSLEKFNPSRKTVIVYRKNGFFEPIYIYTKMNDQKYTSSGLFKKGDMPNLDIVMNMAEHIYIYECNPKSSSCNSIYPFKQNIISTSLIKKLIELDYKIVYQVLNYNNKCVGIVAQNKKKGFIPCYPSAIQEDYPIVYLDQDIWSDYKDTVSFLTHLHEESNEMIPCKPVIRTLENGLVFGILTETNQLVLLDTPQENIMKDDLIVYETVNEYTIDKMILKEPTIDYERETYVKRIKLEGQFYNAFRNMVRNQLHTPLLYTTKIDMMHIVESSMSYNEKYERLVDIIKSFMYESISFEDGLYTDLVLSNIDIITNCNTNCETKPYCFTTEDSCLMIIPKYHLISNLDNEVIYVGRLTDEFIRYPHIQQFMLKATFLSLQNIQYNLLPTEIILLKSMVDQEYFDRITTEPLKSVYHTNYDVTNPIASSRYPPIKSSEFFNVEEEINIEHTCIDSRTEKIRGHKWVSLLPSESYEELYKSSVECTYRIIQDIIQDYLTKDVSISVLKSQLYQFYSQYSENRIVQILYDQGKRTLFRSYRKGDIQLETVLLSEHYYLTSLDIWVLSHIYHLPVVMLSGVKLPENNREINIVHDASVNIYFIKIPTIKPNEIPGFVLYRTTKIGYLYPQLLDSMKQLIEQEHEWNEDNDFTLDSYLNYTE